MDQLNLINQSTAIIITLGISLLFIVIGISYSKKHQGLQNYLLANRSVGVFSLTSSLVASALGAWILFQSVLNLGASVYLLPITGIVLPFVSYGGTAMVSIFVALGIMHCRVDE